jgi:hypothetical protein
VPLGSLLTCQTPGTWRALLSSWRRCRNEFVEVPVRVPEVGAPCATELVVGASVRRILGIVAEGGAALAQAPDCRGERLGRDPDREVQRAGCGTRTNASDQPSRMSENMSPESSPGVLSPVCTRFRETDKVHSSSSWPEHLPSPMRDSR